MSYKKEFEMIKNLMSLQDDFKNLLPGGWLEDDLIILEEDWAGDLLIEKLLDSGSIHLGSEVSSNLNVTPKDSFEGCLRNSDAGSHLIKSAEGDSCKLCLYSWCHNFSHILNAFLNNTY